ncbi:MAG: GNAT family N-acetyltransferase [Saprospiraceae bacterium]
METIIAPISSAQLCIEINHLDSDAQLMSRGDFEVYFAQAHQIPNVLLEIGRLRELTFRSVGEGTGKALDIDEFDQYYYNLFIWDKKNNKIVGGYRMGMGEQVFQKKGIENFYIHSLFEIDEAFFPTLKKSIELGRSYIVPEYQKGYLPFFLLWQGILKVLIKNPAYQYLIGPVSISKYYSGVSKSMMVEFVKRYFFDNKNAKHFSPRTPFQPELEQVNLEKMLDSIQGEGLKDLENFLCSIEPEHIKVPVLLKQYTKLNAKFISFNLDPHFSDALDGLMILDLENLPKEIIELLSKN